ncbi:hypothetical protein ACVWZR_003404 [Bradyrhizobium sp. i1.3.1]
MSLGTKILDRLDVGIAADQRHRLRRGRDDALHAAAGAVPQQQKIAGAGVEDVDAAGEQRIGLRAAAGKGHPFGGDAGYAERSCVLLDQLLLFHDVARHVENAGLARQRDLGFLLRMRRGYRQDGCGDQGGSRKLATKMLDHCCVFPPASVELR